MVFVMNSVRVRDFCGYFPCPAGNFAGIRCAADAGLIDGDGYIHVMTRTDDIINVAAHRLSTGEIEEVRAAHPDVAECAVIGVADALKGQVPLGLLVLKAGVVRPADEVEREAVAGLPKTPSGKILRGTMRKIAEGEGYPLPPTIDDPAVLAEIDRAFAAAGYAKR
jgi:propionyl-CoA synthetase